MRGIGVERGGGVMIAQNTGRGILIAIREGIGIEGRGEIEVIGIGSGILEETETETETETEIETGEGTMIGDQIGEETATGIVEGSMTVTGEDGVEKRDDCMIVTAFCFCFLCYILSFMVHKEVMDRSI